jgi:2-C-methyl-D-erythritol 4-phosphate cytidylyltransferase
LKALNRRFVQSLYFDTMEKYALIVAGGSGSRMGTEIPKQFLSLGNAPILMHTVKRFFGYSDKVNIIVVLPTEQISRWKQLCEKNQFNIPHSIVAGGNTRFESVRNGLNSISNQSDALVAIHDGVRPFVSKKVLDDAYNTAAEKGNAIASVALKDSIRKIDNGKNTAVDRAKHRIMQTPQTFLLSTITSAFSVDESPLFTDDAAVAEASGENINLIEGSYENIKITTPEDLALAEAIMQKFEF